LFKHRRLFFILGCCFIVFVVGVWPPAIGFAYYLLLLLSALLAPTALTKKPIIYLFLLSATLILGFVLAPPVLKHKQLLLFSCLLLAALLAPTALTKKLPKKTVGA
jgi:hypothetical protein